MTTTVDGSPPAVATSACWKALVLLADRVRRHAGPLTACSLLIGDDPQVRVGSAAPPAGDGWAVSIVVEPCAAASCPSPGPGETRYALDDVILLRLLAQGDLPGPEAALLELYLPYCLAPVHARHMRRAFAVTHFAQSLDGRIATSAGDARWIGCDENRVHAHRMRALCDGILIGARTLQTDRPALTVRHADGSDPTRIVVGGAAAGDVDCLERAGSSPILLIGDQNGPVSGRVERVALPKTNGRIATAEILKELYRHDILSVYVEGGATTTSAFLAEGNIDVLQLHISPMIIGPGINSFSTPAILSVGDSVRFGAHVYRSVGDGMMFVGRLATNGAAP